MRSFQLALLASAAFGGLAPSSSSVLPATALATQTNLTAKLPGFASELSSSRPILEPGDWPKPELPEAWTHLASVQSQDRQAARWSYALGLRAAGREADALGVLDVMAQDDPDLALVSTFQLARGAVLASLGRNAEAATALNQPLLANNPEACAWRLRAFTNAKAYGLAARQVACAVPAINSRKGADRVPFVLAAAQSALRLEQPEVALRMLKAAPEKSADANLLRARAATSLGQYDAAQSALEMARAGARPDQQMASALANVELGVSKGSLMPKAAMKELSRVEYLWRGDEIEERALRLTLQLARQTSDQRAALRAAATLIRYHKLGADLPRFVQDVQEIMASLLDPSSSMPIEQAAGIYWDYRELAPSGAEGTLLATRLADKFASLGLYARAAELLEYQMRSQGVDVTQGPLSVRVAKLHILSGRPDRAVAALSQTSNAIYPGSMIWDRKRIEAVALFQLGRSAEAFAVLQDVPDSDGLRAEMIWKQRDYETFVSSVRTRLPAGRGLSEVNQSTVLRYAIALGMLRREAELAQLRTRYLAAFQDLPTASALDVLTRKPGSIDTSSLTRAMAAIPVASPAGDLADLLEMAPAETKGGG